MTNNENLNATEAGTRRLINQSRIGDMITQYVALLKEKDSFASRIKHTLGIYPNLQHMQREEQIRELREALNKVIEHVIRR